MISIMNQFFLLISKENHLMRILIQNLSNLSKVVSILKGIWISDEIWVRKLHEGWITLLMTEFIDRWVNFAYNQKSLHSYNHWYEEMFTLIQCYICTKFIQYLKHFKAFEINIFRTNQNLNKQEIDIPMNILFRKK